MDFVNAHPLAFGGDFFKFSAVMSCNAMFCLFRFSREYGKGAWWWLGGWAISLALIAGHAGLSLWLFYGRTAS